MPELKFDEAEAGKRWYELIRRVQAGEKFIITREGKPLARLVPLPTEQLASEGSPTELRSRRRR